MRRSTRRRSIRWSDGFPWISPVDATLARNGLPGCRGLARSSVGMRLQGALIPCGMILRRDQAAAMPFIMLTTLIDMVSIGLMIPVLPALVGSFSASQSEQALWYGVVTFTFGLANFFASPILGALSDAHGRRPVLLLGFCGLALSFLLTALATSLAMLVAIRVLSGAMQANMSVSNAYVADITPPQER